MIDHISETMPKFYGSVTVGERGQVAIPAEARREMIIEPATKLLAFGHSNRRVLLLIKAEFATEMLASATAALSQFEQMVKAEHAEEPK
ncbi:MAG TPA: AbrB/MazE/SpoVT family DNA-binding domain-containing protein [Dehalococcoidales bacterium]|nr:AbrB/MazE/SpoVT family DNA-binding domain-containing protein [Dehalococcoidales bacterium]